MLLVGYDLGSSSIKAALVDGNTGKTIKVVKYPDIELSMISEQEGWAEQNPTDWWEDLVMATDRLFEKSSYKRADVGAIGISYQMHGLVAVDKNNDPIRPSIIWCDSRAVDIGDKAFEDLGNEYCLHHALNSPGNFTASKLRWVKENEPENFEKIHRVMLPGDFIALKLTGKSTTTVTGLSEGIFWDYQSNDLFEDLLKYYGIERDLIPEIVPVFAEQGSISEKASAVLGFPTTAVVSYRAGDQPNNAFSLNVVEPGEVAATAGTSGVVYGITDQLKYDPQSRVNTFAHVNHEVEAPRLGVLLCVNGAGIAYGWLRNQMAPNESYPELENKASKVPVGAEGLSYMPFGNGAERMFGNQVLGAQLNNLHFNKHTFSHLVRATLEGVAFSFVYGIECMKETGLIPGIIKAGNDNMFQSEIFSNAISTLTGSKIELKETTGAVGAALGAGYGAGVYNSLDEAFVEENITHQFEPDIQNKDEYEDAYAQWLSHLKNPKIAKS